MSPRLYLFGAGRALTSASRWTPGSEPGAFLASVAPRRAVTADEKPRPTSDQPKGPNQDQLPHVSEEAAAIGKITGEGGPNIEQGTPVEDILRRDPDGQEKAPQVLKNEMGSQALKGARSFSTSTRRREVAAVEVSESPLLPPGLKFEAPPKKLPTTDNLRRRYHPVVDQVTKMLMKDGKKSLAQRNMTRILSNLRTTPPPFMDPKRPLLSINTPANALPLNPVLYLTLAIDSVAPLMRIRSQRGAAGGGLALQIPVALGMKQRRRTAMKWILDAVKNKPSGGGNEALAKKIADEIISIVEGRSGVWTKRDLVHRMGITARANVKWAMTRKR